jgi:hypothetical protein
MQGGKGMSRFVFGSVFMMLLLFPLVFGAGWMIFDLVGRIYSAECFQKLALGSAIISLMIAAPLAYNAQPESY